MKKLPANPTEQRCPACNGTGFPAVRQPVQPGRGAYPPPCKECGGKGRIKKRPPAEAALRHHRDIAGPAMEVGPMLSLHRLEAIRDAFNGWHLGIFRLGQTRHTSVAALRAL